MLFNKSKHKTNTRMRSGRTAPEVFGRHSSCRLYALTTLYSFISPGRGGVCTLYLSSTAYHDSAHTHKQSMHRQHVSVGIYECACVHLHIRIAVFRPFIFVRAAIHIGALIASLVEALVWVLVAYNFAFLLQTKPQSGLKMRILDTAPTGNQKTLNPTPNTRKPLKNPPVNQL